VFIVFFHVSPFSIFYFSRILDLPSTNLDILICPSIYWNSDLYWFKSSTNQNSNLCCNIYVYLTVTIWTWNKCIRSAETFWCLPIKSMFPQMQCHDINYNKGEQLVWSKTNWNSLNPKVFKKCIALLCNYYHSWQKKGPIGCAGSFR
jgi:hypothetical protein